MSEDPRSLTPPLPTNLYFEVTNRCNLPCQTCVRTFNLHEPERDPLPQELKQAAAALPELRRMVLQGIGEPLLNKKLPEMIRFGKAQGAWVLFNSNGVLLDRAWQDTLIDCGLDELRVSIDAATPETYRAIRGAPAFDRVMTNLEQFVARKAERGVLHPRLSLWMVAMRSNFRELPALVDLAARIGVPEVYFQRLVYNGLGVAQQAQSLHGETEGEVAAVVEEAMRRGERGGVAVRASGATTPLESLRAIDEPRPWSRCRRPWDTILCHGARQGAAVLHRTVFPPGLPEPGPRRSYGAVARGGLARRALPGIPETASERRAASMLPDVRGGMEPVKSSTGAGGQGRSGEWGTRRQGAEETLIRGEVERRSERDE
jgi:MoaA/NifB/PqqE/SkfB family radical SAM enzyme